MAAFVAELEAERVSPARLREALRTWAAADPPHADRARVLGELFEGYHRALDELGRTDPERRAVDALDALRRAPALWGGTPVALYGFDDFSRLQLDAIETLGTVVGAPVTVSLPYEPGRTAFAGRAGTFQTLAPLAAEHRALPPRREHYAPSARAALHHLERSLFEPEGRTPIGAGDAVRLIEGAGERDELELVAGEIRGLLDRGMAPGGDRRRAPLPGDRRRAARGGVPGARDPPCATAAREVRRHRRRPRPVGLLAAALEEPAGDAARDVRAGDEQVGDARAGDACAGDACAGDERAWQSGLENLLAWLRAPGVLRRPELADASRRGRGARAPRPPRRHGRCGRPSTGRSQALDGLREAAARGPTALIERAARELEWLFCAPRLHAANVLAPAEQPEARALAVGRRALEELRDLSRRVPELAPDGAELIAILGSLELSLSESPAGVGGDGRGPARAARAAGASAVPVRVAGGRVPGAAPSRAAALRRRAPRAGAGFGPVAAGPAQTATAPWRRSATCCTPRCPGRRSCWCSAGTPPTTTASPARGRCLWTTSATCSPTTCD